MRRLLALVPFLLLPTACGDQGGTTASAPSSAPATTAATTATADPAQATTAAQPTATADPAQATTPAQPTATAAATAAPVDGQQHAIIKKIDPATRVLTYDLVEYFVGKAAVKACADDGEKPADSDWCVGYYIRNDNPKLRTATFAPGATIRVIDLGELKKAELERLEPGTLLRFEIKNRSIITADQVFLP
ncbi:hypothetical protein [Actinoplanes sp. CA-252034]|uniref:hypothetical protein n=1 Tax=Actinoplanes sp. CA-252034 TaxID=3239906 RepID=UPI003D9637FE